MKAHRIHPGAQPTARPALPLAAGVPGQRQAVGQSEGRTASAPRFDRLVADQQMYAQRVAEAITALRRPARVPAAFPREFAAKNDLSLEFLLPEIIACQERDVAAIAQCAGQLEGDLVPARPGRGNPRQRQGAPRYPARVGERPVKE